jgi:hypothetical protein
MSQQDVEREILTKMQGIYLPPRQFTEELVKENLKEYAEALDGYSVEDLRFAWSQTRNSHTGRAWPSPGVFVTFAARHKNERMSSAGITKGSTEGRKANENWKNWERVRNLPIAKDAAQKGVAWSLKCQILSGLQPGTIDLNRLMQDRARAERLYWKIKDNQPVPSLAIPGRESVIREPLKEKALSMWLVNQQNEAATAREVGYAGQVDAAADEIDYGALVP